MKINAEIVKLAEEYVRKYLIVHLDKKFMFHDLSHTVSVAEAVDLICGKMEINKQDKRILVVAAWFHDLGYTQRIDEHEDIGAALAEQFLREHDVDEKEIATVKNCIIATHYPQYPLSELEKVLCDADMIHLADKDYMEHAEVLRKEWAITREKNYTDEEWLDINIKFLSSHSYHTTYCRENFEERKTKNLRKLMLQKQPGNEIKKEKKNRSYEYGRGAG